MESELILSRAEAQEAKELLVMEAMAGRISVGTYDKAVSVVNRNTVPS